ncbi:hypothetical protein ABS772_07650 [Methylorubrum podarium]|uniref:Uncharacterized protein n=1 Tax=Methylorubrum podarium TaxID=200476 RepID=A0ABV1QK68_9HYPH
MAHFTIAPEVAGGLGANTVLDRGRHPPMVQRLHYEFEGWLGDVLLESFPAFIVTEEARQALVQEGVTDARFDEVEVSLSDTFRETQPGTTLPRFVWLLPEGEPGQDDIAAARDGRLVLSQRALDVLQARGLSQALVEPFTS